MTHSSLQLDKANQALLDAFIHEAWDRAEAALKVGASVNAFTPQKDPVLVCAMSRIASATWPRLIDFALEHGLSAAPHQGLHVILIIKMLMESDLDHTIMKTLTTLLTRCPEHIDLQSPIIKATIEDLHDRNFQERRPNPILRVEALSQILDHYERGYDYAHITNYTAAQGAIIEGLFFERPEDKPIALEAAPHEFGGTITIAIYRPDEDKQLLLNCKPAIFANCRYGVIKGQYYRDHHGHHCSNVIEDLIGTKIRSIDLLTNLRLDNATLAITLEDGRTLRILSYIKEGTLLQRISLSKTPVNPEAIDPYRLPNAATPIASASSVPTVH